MRGEGTEARRRLVRIAAAAVLAVAVTVGVASCSLLGGNSNVPVATAKPPTGTDAAVDFDGGFVSAGTGSKKVDIWFDAMCPVCGAFEKTNGETLSNAVKDGSITLRLHPLTFLDRASNGTGYSTRAAAALVCVGVHDPDHVLDYYQALFTDQPDENSNGLTDKQLAKRATDLGITDISACIDRSGPYQAWAQANTAHSQSGPITVDGKKVLDTIQGTPTVLVNGTQYTGSISDEKEFASFLGSK
ncbi:thioredoxin domain-containing protein [Leifsonia sp. TF02-11]|uniref:DsbA family protein n=1 Tax=Leifsonia sp. TF02-11 TaxID=2815212 RepID=UPI001AA11740|nr:thioredoxin domain-containing protein [Leifsonia sp. TF02-11]MBO1738490.1 thioredoxin domain-containing protein [Leifsonia sp. TF02-11]